jgi:hypothetical protein
MKKTEFKNIAGKTVFGYTDAVNDCDCCGKTGLKGTYCCELEGGQIVHFGSVCVYKNTGLSKKQVKEQVEYTIKYATNERYKEMKASKELQEAKTRWDKRSREISGSGINHWTDVVLKEARQTIDSIENAIHAKYPMLSKYGRLSYNGLPNSPK